ncbi:protein misato homolog 1 [Gadus macrocephalus]|uniref:protein misato homolog 1 n=1 Tax=Gadus macrocephalus TaxID=80720 RepID=UPI0028CBA503|nr:protein misato homolog 1 [Gadus macrocephalus]
MSSLCKELVTLQLGHYSNFVGTHWWNLQDASLSEELGEINSDVAFREGRTIDGQVTYTPRLIAMDLKGSLQTLRQEGCLYSTNKESSPISWEGPVTMHQESPVSKNPFLLDLDKLETGGLLAQVDYSDQANSSGAFGAGSVNRQLERVAKSYALEGSVRVWSDFLRIHLHPRTVSVIHQYNHGGETHRLEAFGQGEPLLQGPVLEDLEDRLHFFIEECDNLQGFQVLCDLTNGFSGLGSKVTELLQDSYGGKGILTWGMVPVTHPDTTPMKDIYHVINTALGMVHMANNSSFFCPLTLRGGLGRRPGPPVAFPHLTYDPSLWYHSSSVLALALDALTAPCRLRQNGVPVGQMADLLTGSGRKVVAAYGAVPLPMMQGATLPDALSSCADALPWRPLSSCPDGGGGQCFAQLLTLRGLDEQRLVSRALNGPQAPNALHGLKSGEDVLASYMASFYPTGDLAMHLLSSPSLLTPPFPQVFSSDLGEQGCLQSRCLAPGAVPPIVSSVPVLSCLQSGPALGPWLAELHRAVGALNIRRLAPSFLSQGPELSEYEEALEQLRLLARCYRDDNRGAAHFSSEDSNDDSDD